MSPVDASTAPALVALETIYGRHIPANADAALQMVEASPFKPTDPAVLVALRGLVVDNAGKDIEAIALAAGKIDAGIAQAGHGQRPLGGGVAARLQALATTTVAPSTTSTTPLQRAVDESTARELFDTLAAAKDIPHGFVEDGCHFRAHLVAKRLEEAGVFSEKVFLAPDSSDLRINSDKAVIGFALAMFHAATSIYVRNDDGKVERRIIDPSLCDGPATLEQWASRMEAVDGSPCRLTFLPRFAMMLWERDEPPAEWKQQDLDDALAWNGQYSELLAEMKKMNLFDEFRRIVADAGTQAP